MDIVRKYMAFTHAGVRCHNTCNVGKAVKFRGWLLALLAMHLLVHPMTHAIAALVTPAAVQSVSIQSVSYESLRIATKLPSRAPPTL